MCAKAYGMSLIEMLITLGIVAILGAVAAPSFVDVRANAARTSAVNDFFHAIFLARSESIKRGEVVSLCKSADGATCLGRAGSWSDGWIVFVNEDGDELPVRDPDEAILSVYGGWSSGAIESNRHAYSFRPFTQAVVNGTITFCDARGSAEARAIIISHTGRPRIARKDSSNKPLKCV